MTSQVKYDTMNSVTDTGDNNMKKKNFYYKVETLKRNKMYGYNTNEVSIYYLDSDGAPHLIDRVTYQTGCTPGAQNEAFKLLKDTGHIPAIIYEHFDFHDSGAYKDYNLYEMF